MIDKTIVLHLTQSYAGFGPGYAIGKGVTNWQFDHLLMADIAYMQEPDGRLKVIKDRSITGLGPNGRILTEAESIWILLQVQSTANQNS